MLRAQVVLALALGLGCGGDTAPVQPDAATHREVTVLRAVPNHALDLVFVVEDSQSLDIQTNLKAAMGVLHDLFESLDPPVYDVQLGVLSTDMGTQGSLAPGQPAPAIGSCEDIGKDGRLQTAGSLVTGLFVHERLDADGTLTTNYTGTFEQAMATLLSLGAGGCGFEQPLAALRRALANPFNAGFFRDGANLAVVLFVEEDDCSVRDPAFFSTDTSVLGPVQSFRCTRWGLQCHEDVNAVGRKTGCRPWHDSPYLEDVVPFRDALLAHTRDPRMLAVTGLIGDPEPVEVELRTPPGGGAPVLTLAHSCGYIGAAVPQVADPGKRLEHFLDGFPPETSAAVTSICSEDLSTPIRQISTAIKHTLGDPCIETRGLRDVDLATPGVQPSCVVEDVSDSDPQRRAIAPCPADGDCFELVADERACPYQPEHTKLLVYRATTPAADVWTHVRCELD